MKKSFLIFNLIFLISFHTHAQKTLPAIKVTSIDGNEVQASDFTNEKAPIIISFWATWCKPCISELDAINEVYEDWQEESGVKLIAISIDDERSTATVKSLVAGRDWPYEIYLDKNQQLKRAMNVVNVPHTFLLNGNGEIVWQHNSYIPGSEDELWEEIIKLTEINIENEDENEDENNN